MTSSYTRLIGEFVSYRCGSGGVTDAETYDSIRYGGVCGTHRLTVLRDATVPWLRTLSGKRVLDVGCGTGRGLLDADNLALFSVGLDASGDMLRLARQKPTGGRVSFVGGSAAHLPFRDRSFDAAIGLNFLHLFDIEIQRCFIDEMIRVLVPGGILHLEFDNAMHGFGIGAIRRYLGGPRGSFLSEITDLVGGRGEIAEVRAALVPGLWRMARTLPRLALAADLAVTKTSLAKLLCSRIYVTWRILGTGSYPAAI